MLEHLWEEGRPLLVGWMSDSGNHRATDHLVVLPDDFDASYLLSVPQVFSETTPAQLVASPL